MNTEKKEQSDFVKIGKTQYSLKAVKNFNEASFLKAHSKIHNAKAHWDELQELINPPKQIKKVDTSEGTNK